MYWPALILTSILLAGYCCLILVYREWFLRLPLYQPGSVHPPVSRFSVIIPARDEEENIGRCLASVLQQDYPVSLFEVIVVNDHSSDRTEQIVHEWQGKFSQLRLINLAEKLADPELNSYKKKAIELAVAESHYEWIVTTDADCTVPHLWLHTLDNYLAENDQVFVAAPVMFHRTGSFVSIFQLLDFISLQGITAAAVSAGKHAMCNGANLAYRKDVFYGVGQFRGIDNIASGDDMLLMHKIKSAYPNRIGYLFSQSSIVLTDTMSTWKDFIQQRIRWASKADKYNDKTISWVLALVYAVNLSLLALFFISLFTEDGWMNWLILVMTKTLIEWSFMLPVARFYRQTAALVWFPFMQPLHIAYTVVAGWLGKFGTYSWKGRNVK